MTPVSAKITSPVSTVSEIFHYQHKGYFREKLIILTISKVISNCWAEWVVFASFSQRYKDLFHYYILLKRNFLYMFRYRWAQQIRSPFQLLKQSLTTEADQQRAFKLSTWHSCRVVGIIDKDSHCTGHFSLVNYCQQRLWPNLLAW